MQIKKATTEGEFLECEAILRSLKEWFGQEESNNQYAKDIRQFDTYVALLENQIVGYFTIKYLTKFSVELHLLGIYEQYHRKHIGSKLLQFIENKLIEDGIQYLKVETLSDKSPDPFYSKTRAFYYKNGFVDFQEIKDWGPDNPGIVLVKKI
ncbi:MAG: GNAT family N-acetyltransferase [bacterium]